MTFLQKINVSKLIEKKDIKALQKASESNDYLTRRDAIIGLINLREIIPNMIMLLTLVNDPKPSVRLVAYEYSLVGEFGLFANITALHDKEESIRLNAIKILTTYHKNKTIEIIRQCSVFDPNQRIRDVAKANCENLSSPFKEKNLVGSSIEKTNQFEWISNESLMRDFAFLMEKEENYNPVYIRKDGLYMCPYGSPYMLSCRDGFKKAQITLCSDKEKAIQWLTYAQNCAIKGMNSVTKNIQNVALLNEGEIPYSDYLLCTTILLTKLIG